MQGVWFPNFIRRHRPHMDFGVAPFPAGRGVLRARPGDPNEPTISSLDADVIAIPRGCPHPQEAWRFVHWVQTEGLKILCRLQGKHLPWAQAQVPGDFRQGHPNRELAVFEQVAASENSFAMPRMVVWREYQDELSKAFEHVWNWPVPEEPLRGLSGQARQSKVEELCREEIAKTLAAVRERAQKQYDLKVQRERMRQGGNP
jgi:ABC-type glycerol-3-phosphate transport system substrate-binding protein